MSFRVRFPRPLKTIRLSDTALMRTIGQGLVGRIRSRTTRGVDVDGRPFQRLSASYGRAKRKALGHASANLTVSGRMLNDMQAKPRPTGLTIGFVSQGGRASRGSTFIQRSRAVGAGDKAFYHNEAGAGASRVIREFFGLSDEDEDFILNHVRAFIDKELR